MRKKLRIFKSIIFGAFLLVYSFFDTFLIFEKKWMYTSVYYFKDDTFWVLLEAGKVRVLKVIGVGVGVGVPGVGVVCFFLL